MKRNFMIVCIAWLAVLALASQAAAQETKLKGSAMPLAVPMHFGTFPGLLQTADEFASRETRRHFAEDRWSAAVDALLIILGD